MKKRWNAAKIIIVLILAGGIGLIGWRIFNRPRPSEAVSISAIRARNGMPVTEWRVANDEWNYWLPLYGTVRTSGLSEVFASEAEYVTSIPVEVGDVVKKGDVLATLDSKKAMERVQAAEARFSELAMKYERMQELQKAGGTSKQDVENAFTQYRDAGASLQSLRTELSRHKVVSPIDGVIMQRNAEIGLLAGSGRSLFVIGDPRQFEVEIDLSPRYIHMVRSGEPAAYMDQNGKWQNARVKRVDPMANSVTGLYSVVLGVETNGGENARLSVGASVEARIRIEHEQSAVAIPYEAVREIAGQSRVYVCSGDVAVERFVERGRTNDRGLTRINEGLREGESIVLKGADRMYDGARIWIQHEQGSQS